MKKDFIYCTALKTKKEKNITDENETMKHWNDVYHQMTLHHIKCLWHFLSHNNNSQSFRTSRASSWISYQNSTAFTLPNIIIFNLFIPKLNEVKNNNKKKIKWKSRALKTVQTCLTHSLPQWVSLVCTWMCICIAYEIVCRKTYGALFTTQKSLYYFCMNMKSNI